MAMTVEQRVVGWLIMSRYNHEFDIIPMLPPDVVDEAKALGLVNQRRGKAVAMTDRARTLCDLNAPEWGVELDFSEEEGA